MTTTIEKIQHQIAENPILLYMKGSPKLPNCGFSAQAVQALSACGERFAYVDILQNPDIRSELPKYANWPTFPQLWVDGELVGGCDIIMEMYQRGELQQLIKETAEKYKQQEDQQPVTGFGFIVGRDRAVPANTGPPDFFSKRVVFLLLCTTFLQQQRTLPARP
ncbi:glutaredoxin [Serratia grimesii]|uniref:Glutaredoxin 4 n=2 Tax=Serratia grimesii TaxID=82995 RepID=A0ABR4UB16_9GAMM|nr:glutaredoxin [Serratia grimesii]